MFDPILQIETHATLLHKQVVELRVMPPGISETERGKIAHWHQAQRKKH